ncbi:hypothetical protein [Nostoc sp.]|uniref:hypothetical protein n=1 Tax=Nostoc sp. TaxID=1180 RepID=UPI002FF53094
MGIGHWAFVINSSPSSPSSSSSPYSPWPMPHAPCPMPNLLIPSRITGVGMVFGVSY